MISVVIPAHNEEALLGRTLAALHAAFAAAAPARAFEMVVVDEPDGTKSLVEFNEKGECCTRPMKPK